MKTSARPNFKSNNAQSKSVFGYPASVPAGTGSRFEVLQSLNDENTPNGEPDTCQSKKEKFSSIPAPQGGINCIASLSSQPSDGSKQVHVTLEKQSAL